MQDIVWTFGIAIGLVVGVFSWGAYRISKGDKPERGGWNRPMPGETPRNGKMKR